MSAITMHLGQAGIGTAERDDEFTAFFRDQFPALVRTTYLIVHDLELARDLAQDAFIQLYARWNRVSRYERPDAWVRRVGIRMAVRALKRERIRPHLEHELDIATLPKPLDIDVLRAVRTLPGSQRAAVVLFYFEDRPVSEIAEILRCSEVTAKVHLHRARKKLAEVLGETLASEEVRDVS